MKKTKAQKPSVKKVLISYGLHIWFALFLVNIVIFYSMQFHARGQTCFTVEQVQADNRCLYILSNKVYDNGATRATPHHGHPCGTDVTSVIPSFHTDSPAEYLTPNYVGDICVAPTATPIPTTAPTAIPTPVPTAPVSTQAPTAIPTTVLPTAAASPTMSASIVPSPECLGASCITPQPSTVYPSINPGDGDDDGGGGGGNGRNGGGFIGMFMAFLEMFLRFLEEEISSYRLLNKLRIYRVQYLCNFVPSIFTLDKYSSIFTYQIIEIIVTQ